MEKEKCERGGKYYHENCKLNYLSFNKEDKVDVYLVYLWEGECEKYPHYSIVGIFNDYKLAEKVCRTELHGIMPFIMNSDTGDVVSTSEDCVYPKAQYNKTSLL